MSSLLAGNSGELKLKKVEQGRGGSNAHWLRRDFGTSAFA